MEDFEIALCIQSESIVGQLAVWMNTLQDASEEGVREKNRLEQVFFGIGRLVAPVL